MAGKTDLATLLRELDPRLQQGEYVFATVPSDQPAHRLNPLMRFEEGEGTTLILERSEAEGAQLATSFPCRMITLSVHSSLDAVGLLAAVTGALAAAGIAANPVSAFHHDHLFVPSDRAEEALTLLRRLGTEG